MYHIRTNSNKIIIDVLSYEYEGYEAVNIETLPLNITGGWFKLIDGRIIEVPELKPIDTASEIDLLKQSQVEQDAIIMQLILGGVM